MIKKLSFYQIDGSVSEETVYSILMLNIDLSKPFGRNSLLFLLFEGLHRDDEFFKVV